MIYNNDTLLMLQTQLQQLVQLVGKGGADIQRQVRLIAQQNQQELDVIRQIWSATDVSTHDKWSQLVNWTQRVDTALTQILRNSIPELQQTMPLIWSCTQELGQAIQHNTQSFRNLSESLQNTQLAELRFHYTTEGCLKELQDVSMELLADRTTLQESTAEMSARLDTVSSALGQWESFWTQETPRLKHMAEKQKSQEKTIQSLQENQATLARAVEILQQDQNTGSIHPSQDVSQGTL